MLPLFVYLLINSFIHYLVLHFEKYICQCPDGPFYQTDSETMIILVLHDCISHRSRADFQRKDRLSTCGGVLLPSRHVGNIVIKQK